MEEDPPPPDDPAEAHTAQRQRERGRSESSLNSVSDKSINSTRTLHSVDLTTVTENARTYPNSTYYMPCDAAEQDRLSIMHQVYLSALSGALTSAPITAAVTRILDIGTGPGDWAVGISERFPYAEVVGVDLAVWDVEAVEEAGRVGAGGHAEEWKGGGVRWEIDDLDIWGVEVGLDELSKGMDNIGLETHQEEDAEMDTRHKRTDLAEPTPTEPNDSTESNRPLNHQVKDGSPHLPPETQSSTPPKGKSKAPASAHTSNPYTLDSPSPIGWNFSEPFDFIHARGLKGAFANWSDVYSEIYANLAPGGWVEIVDYEFRLPGANGGLTDSTTSHATPASATPCPSFPHLQILYNETLQASRRAGKPLGTDHLAPSLLENAGFCDVRTTQVNVPVGTWPKDERQRAVGKMFLVAAMEGLEAVCLRLLTRWGENSGEEGGGRWTEGKVRALCENVKMELLEIGKSGGAEGWCKLAVERELDAPLRAWGWNGQGFKVHRYYSFIALSEMRCG
ncbi:hypothetical protein K432DRAFT_415159 [Lepidopterella palustris CBS 459.81]|uniref:S-adenosyl-L-methionine-dependent methyltransferase n=1 Tax=Lepidopterella palustris CBS 459.81 TaxID=1314670 RepID=A0A8E2EF77_9PEZI|nr:hypothetical protein K432DRAFT_415159 [Lepidopterella palustris CBS 459.81]